MTAGILWRGLCLPMALLGVLAVSAPAHANCRAAVDEFQVAVGNSDLARISATYEKIFREPSCPDGARIAIARVAALAHYAEVQRRVDQGSTWATERPVLERSMTYAHVWQVLARLADLEREARDYARAAEFYQAALNSLADEQLTPQAPPVAVIERLHGLTSEMWLLADRYVEAPVTRNNEVGGAAMQNLRGFAITAVPVPVTFETGTTDLTPEGKAAANDMAAWLMIERPRDIRIVGHTDPRGDDAYNRKLSKARADAIALFLEERGILATIETIGAGESEPFKPVDPSAYSDEERWQMDRRVELIR